MIASVYAAAGTFMLAITCIFALFVFVGRVAVIDGNSMEPNLHNGDVVFIRAAYDLPERGEIAAIGRADQKNPSFVKRVIARAGDEVEIRFDTHLIVVNGNVYPEHYKVVDALSVQGDVQYPVTVPEGCVFVLGDNRNDSLDSRFSEIGFIRQEEIAGIAVFRLLPTGEPKIR